MVTAGLKAYALAILIPLLIAVYWIGSNNAYPIHDAAEYLLRTLGYFDAPNNPRLTSQEQNHPRRPRKGALVRGGDSAAKATASTNNAAKATASTNNAANATASTTSPIDTDSFANAPQKLAGEGSGALGAAL